MGTFESASLCFILVTLCGTLVLLQRIKERRIRSLIGMVGLVSMFHGLRLLTARGLEGLEAVAAYSGVADFFVAVLTLVALLVLHGEATRHRLTQLQLRLSQANEPPIPLPDGRVASVVFDPNQTHGPDGLVTQVPPEIVLERVIQESPVAIVAFDENGRVSACNHTVEELYGAGERELLGKTLPALDNKRKLRRQRRRGLRPAEAQT